MFVNLLYNLLSLFAYYLVNPVVSNNFTGWQWLGDRQLVTNNKTRPVARGQVVGQLLLARGDCWLNVVARAYYKFIEEYKFQSLDETEESSVGILISSLSTFMITCEVLFPEGHVKVDTLRYM